MWHRSSYGAVLLMLAAALPLAAQGEVRVTGRVVENETGEPIAEAEIAFRGPQGGFMGYRISGEDGTFEFEARGVAGIKLHAERIGYKPNDTPMLFFDGHDRYEIEIRLDRDAVLLAPLEVVARTRVDPSPMFRDLERRIERGFGEYVTRQDIEERNPSYVTDLLAEVPGVRLQSSGRGSRRIVRIGRSNCPAQVFVDGMLMNVPGMAREVAIDDYVSPHDVAAIEVYRGLASVPAQFLNENAHCGVVAIWTRRGG